MISIIKSVNVHFKWFILINVNCIFIYIVTFVLLEFAPMLNHGKQQFILKNKYHEGKKISGSWQIHKKNCKSTHFEVK